MARKRNELPHKMDCITLNLYKYDIEPFHYRPYTWNIHFPMDET